MKSLAAISPLWSEAALLGGVRHTKRRAAGSLFGVWRSGEDVESEAEHFESRDELAYTKRRDRAEDE